MLTPGNYAYAVELRGASSTRVQRAHTPSTELRDALR